VISYNDFATAIEQTYDAMRNHAVRMPRGSWQGVDVSKKPDMVAYELLHHAFKVPMRLTALSHYREQIKPNLPWADDHFMERVSGNPLNPGIEWRNWPWGASADRFRIDPASVGDPGSERIFDHTYAQRYWPRLAGRFPGGIIPDPSEDQPTPASRWGIYFEYGDLDDVVLELVKEPTTRQAILPIFFPEDTGWRADRRKPCSVSYTFMMNNTKGLDIFYHLRSCDLIRHYRDDLYLTVRLLLWILDRLRSIDPWWNSIAPGDFACYIQNLHVFANDMRNL